MRISLKDLTLAGIISTTLLADPVFAATVNGVYDKSLSIETPGAFEVTKELSKEHRR